jgi:hypothetical protein
MKASVLLMLGMLIAFGYSYNAFGKEPTSAKNKSDTTSVELIIPVLPESFPKKDVIVLNTEMIVNFQRNYDQIEVIPWEELLKSIPASDWGIAYTAYRNLSATALTDNSTTFTQLLAAEMSKVREDLKNVPDSICMITNPNFKSVKPRRIIITKNKE